MAIEQVKGIIICLSLLFFAIMSIICIRKFM